MDMVLRQTRLPAEVIVVDASRDWEANRQLCVVKAAQEHPEIRWEYDPARVRSLTAQRNQALEKATSDVLFLIDDDAFMYPDCAFEVMKVYEADQGRAVAGVAPSQVASPPDVPPPNGGTPPPLASAPLNPIQKLADYCRHLVDVDGLLLPYDPVYPDHPLPPEVSALGAFPCRHFNGFRMTFRREFVQKERFDEMLTRYAAAEDLDASYRVSRHGALAITPHGHIFHAEDPSARLTRYTRYSLGLINLGVLYRLKGYDPSRLLREYSIKIRRRGWVDLVRDLGRGRLSLPYVRAGRHALKVVRSLGTKEASELKDWFPLYQTQLIEQNRG
jgi:hypothetical protein